MSFLIFFLMIANGYLPTLARTDSTKRDLPISRSYITWADERLIVSEMSGSIASLNGYTWHVNSAGDNPFGFTQNQPFIDYKYRYPLLNGSLHPRINHNQIFIDTDTDYSDKSKQQLIVDLSFGNESGDPGVWASTEKITPNSDRIGPDILFNYQAKPNAKNTISVNGFFFETALDDIAQVKRLMTVQDGGLKMPILKSQGLDLAYGYSNKSFRFALTQAYLNSDNYEMNRVIGVELPQNIVQNLSSGELFWKMGNNAPTIDLNFAFQSTKINATGNEINYSTQQLWDAKNLGFSIHQPLVKNIKIGVETSFEEITHTFFSDEYYQTLSYLQISNNKQSFKLHYGFNGNSEVFKNNEHIKITYKIIDFIKNIDINLNVEKYSLPFYKVDTDLTILTNQNNTSIYTSLDLLPWLEEYKLPSITVNNINEWYTNSRVNLDLNVKNILDIRFWYSHWDNFVGLFTNYQYNDAYRTNISSLAIRNEVANVDLIPDLKQYGVTINTSELFISSSKRYSLQFGGQWFKEINSPISTKELQILRMPFPSLQTYTSFTAYFQSDFILSFDLRYRSAVELAYLNGLNGQSHGIHKNTSIVDIGNFSNSTNATFFGNIHLTKIVGTKRPMAFFVDLNNISRNGVIFHPYGATDYMTLMTGVRLRLF